MTRLKKIQYYLIKGTVNLIALMPLRALYVISDCLSWLLHSVVHYRRKVVRENLTSSFPEKDLKEIAAIERKFYRWLTDYFLETLKMVRMSAAEMKRRLQVVNPELVDEAVEKGKSVTLLLGHYCNWEWVSSLPLHFNTDVVPAQVYHYIHDIVLDRIFMDIRTRFGSNNIEMSDIMRRLIEWKRAGVPTVTGFIADQCPKFDMHLFVDFLHHETGVYTGPERIARFLDSDVLFCHLSRPDRGHYCLKFVKITDNVKGEDPFSVTRRYMRMLEDNIIEAPQYWLWSHRRWKISRQDFYDYWGDQADKMLSHI